MALRLHPIRNLCWRKPNHLLRTTHFATPFPRNANCHTRNTVALTSTACFSTRSRKLQADSKYASNKNVLATPGKYTTAFAIFEALWDAGVTACFVNVGAEHAPILEAFVKGKRERANAWPNMVTCPAEVTAISMADGFARVSGRPQAVLVHVDVGTQALGQGIHNASIGRVPVFILAGLVPFTDSGEMFGSRTEYMHWLQDVPDQKAIVRQYCRYVGEIRTGLNAKQVVGRALQFASSAPKGPVYLTAAREVLAEEIQPYTLKKEQHNPIGPGALPHDTVQELATALTRAENPLIITGYSGRDRRTPELLVTLADLIPRIRVHNTSGSDVCFPSTHPASRGFRLSSDECTQHADVLFILDCDVPWIPARNPPRDNALIYHVDIDPLNQQIPVSFFPAHGRWRADSYTALEQLIHHIRSDPEHVEALARQEHISWGQQRVEEYNRLPTSQPPPQFQSDEPLNFSNIGHIIKEELSSSTTFVVEAVTASQILHDQLKPSRPGSWINCGGTGIGWSNGAALGIRMALDELRNEVGNDGLVCQIVGDGSFMCAAPSSALWVASKYKIPILTIVLNNGGWKAPRNSAELVYPSGLNQTATEDELNISFRPSPNYAALAEAATGSNDDRSSIDVGKDPWMKGVRVQTGEEFRDALREAIARVGEQRKGMLVEVMIEEPGKKD